MKHPNRLLSAAIALLLVPISGFSISLGQSTGAVIFGRPLDLTIQARLDGPLDESSNCFSAEIFQGDARFDSSRVRVEVKAAANPLEAQIRIRSTATITEPWAKVILRSNCGTKMSRQYDFLTDFITDSPPGMSNTRLPVLASVARGTQEQQPAVVLSPPGSLTSAAADKVSTVTSSTVRSTAIKQGLVKAAPPREARSTTTVKTNTDDATSLTAITPAARPDKLKSTKKLAAKATSIAEGKSRLKMETVDFADERQVMLKMSTALLMPVVSDTPANAQALAQAAAVWRALNAKPEELAADAQKLQATVAELQSVKNRALNEQASLQERLRVAEQKEFANPLVYGLLALLVLTLSGLAWMGFRARKSAQAGYAWLGHTTIPADAQTLADMEVAEPAFVDTLSTTPAPATAPAFAALEETPIAFVEERADVQAMPETQSEALSAPMVFTKPAPKVEVHVNNNPLWPAEAVSAHHADGAAALVMTPAEAFVLPITQPEPALQATTPQPPAVLNEVTPNLQWPQQTVISQHESLNIDLDFSKIAPPVARMGAKAKRSHVDKHIDNHIEFYSDDEHAKAVPSEEPNQAGERKPKSPPPLPKSVRKPHKPATPLASDHKSNLIDFESFANAPAPPRPSRFTS